MNDTTTNDAQLRLELQDLARRARAWADAREWTAARAIREFRALGSDRTWRDLREGRFDGYSVADWLEGYRGIAAQMEARDAQAAEEPVYEDLSAVRDVRLAATRAMAAFGTNRVVLAIGESGMGKSKALEALCRNYGSRIVPVEAQDVWADSPREFLGALLEALGEAPGGLPNSASGRMARCRTLLGRARRLVAVDEAQHLGPRCLAAVKSLVNATPGEWLLLSMGTRGWLASDAYVEARQLATNRLSSCLRLHLVEGDCQRYLAHCFPAAGRDVLKACARLARPAAQGNGNMAFLRDAAAEAAAMTPEGAALAPETFQEAVRAVSARRAGA